MKNKVGIIGNGFVGESQAFAFSPIAEIRIFDIDPLKSTHTLSEVCECDFVFVSVPTPMKNNGEQDTSYIDNVFNQVKSGPIFIIKSTVLPGTTQKLIKKYNKLDIIFSPEFLTERTAKLDMLTQARIIFGGSKRLCNKIKKLYDKRFMNRHYIITDSTTAELIKYMNNTFFATKVSIMNEFKRLSDVLGTDWETASHGFAADGRIGDSHLHVPGPDGKLGYGGTCFPKDVNAIVSLGEEMGTPMNTIKAGWKTNLEVRPEADWNKLKGRAVS
jgi:UDPglucose 6-dehydrogenase